MAGDWVKMRTDLYRDPKVIVIADLLMDKKSDLALFINQNLQRDMSVTRNVMRNAVVGALVSVWGVLRHQGYAVELDLRIDDVSLAIVDDIADMPGLGEAMEAAGWVEEDSEGLLFPKFYAEYNNDPRGDEKEKNRERQRRYRQRKKDEKTVENRNVTRNAKSNAREEKRRDKNPPTPLGGNGCLKALGLVLEDISRSQLGKKAEVTAWAERNVPKLSQDVRNKILACSAKARRIGRDPPRLFLSLVRIGLEQGKWQFEQQDEDAVARSRRQKPEGEIG